MELPITELRKNNKRNRILSTIRYGDNVSRHDVKKATNYSMTTVLNVISNLIEEGIVIEEECEDSRVGRRPTWLRINPGGRYFIGVDFNARKLNCVVVNLLGDVVYHKNYKDLGTVDVDTIIEIIKKSILEALDNLERKKEKVIGIGIGSPGFVNKTEGVSVEYSNIKDWNNIPLCKILEEEFNCKVLIENNVNIMAVAYRWMRYEETTDDFVLVSVRHGIKMSMVLNNRLFNGNSGNAGEIAHIKMDSSNRPCPCGRNGCLDTVASFRGIKNRIIEGMLCNRFNDIREIVGDDFNRINEQIFMNSIKNGFQDSINLLIDAAFYLGKALSIVVATIDPKKIILTGSIVCDLFIKQVRKTINEYVLIENLKVVEQKADDHVGAVGAALIVMDNEFEVMEGHV